MLLATRFLRQAAVVLVLAAATFQPIPARADDEFPFGLEMNAGYWRQRRGHARTVVQGRQGPVFNCRQHRDLCRRSVGGSRLPTGAGAGRRRTGRSIERGRDLEAAGRFRFIHRNETAALPSQYQLKSLEPFQAKPAPDLVRGGRRFASRKRVKTKTRASVLIQSEPNRI